MALHEQGLTRTESRLQIFVLVKAGCRRVAPRFQQARTESRLQAEIGQRDGKQVAGHGGSGRPGRRATYQ